MSLPDTTIPDSIATAASHVGASNPADNAPLTLRDRLHAWRDEIYGSKRFQKWAASFPLLRPVARKRARAVFDLCAGFVYSQTLQACFELQLFRILADGPQSTETLARRTRMPMDGLERLLRAATSLGLVEQRSAGRWGLGRLGGPMVDDDALAKMVEHHRLFYEDLRNPLALLRKSGGETALARYWPYAESSAPQAIDSASSTPYTTVMAATLPPVAEDVLDHYDVGRHNTLMDVGGGEGVFLQAAAQRHAHLKLHLFDLPSVADRAKARLTQAGLSDRTTLTGGNFHADELPRGADLISLVRILLDHSDENAKALLTRVHRALPPGGTLLIAEPFAGLAGTEPLADAYFGFYLWAMGRGRARSVAEHRGMLAEAGFRSSRMIQTRLPVWASVIVATA